MPPSMPTDDEESDALHTPVEGVWRGQGADRKDGQGLLPFPLSLQVSRAERIREQKSTLSESQDVS